MRKDVGVDGDAQRLSQLVWMLFLKIFDDRESEWNYCKTTTNLLCRRNIAGVTGQQMPKE